MTTTPKLDMEQAPDLLDIAAARLICEKAVGSWSNSPPPWRVENSERWMIHHLLDAEGRVLISSDCALPYGLLRFIAYSRQALPAALEEIERLRGLLGEACEIAERRNCLDAGKPTCTCERLREIQESEGVE